ncbi:MAG: GNAT family N-acetyltransferase [Marmoricola sp.]
MRPEPTVRPEESEAEEVARVVRAAFGADSEAHGAEVANLWAEVVDEGHVRASLVAEVDGVVVGHVGLSHAWLDARRELVDVWMLSPLSVDPDFQQRGIGSALVAEAITAAGAARAPLLFLEGSPDFYGRRGFSRGSRQDIEAATTRLPEAAFQVVLLGAHEGWMAGRVVLHDVWWRHDSTGLRDPRLAALEERFA